MFAHKTEEILLIVISLEVYLRFGEIFCLHFQGKRVWEERSTVSRSRILLFVTALESHKHRPPSPTLAQPEIVYNNLP
jgi:hypothetical protein